MEPGAESSLTVLRLFGHPPTLDDLRYVGRWSYAAAWLARDRTTAREIVRARLRVAVAEATAAAMSVGRGDANRFVLVSALARLAVAIDGASGPLADAVERAIAQAADSLVRDGAELRKSTQRECAAIAPRLGLDTFEAGLLDVGQERHVLMREVASSLDEALIATKGTCPALQVMRLFLQATLKPEFHESDGFSHPSSFRERDPVATHGAWLMADLALISRRASAYEAAWCLAVRASGDAFSRAIAGLSTGASLPKGSPEAFAEDPWALPLALAMTSTPEHAKTLLDLGVRGQAHERIGAKRAVARWAAQSQRLEEVEASLAIRVLVSCEMREGHREPVDCDGLDLFSAWHVVQRAEESERTLRASLEGTIGAETTARREAVRKAKGKVESLSAAYEKELDSLRSRADAPIQLPEGFEQAEAGVQRGCLYGIGVGGSVLGTYAAVTLFVGAQGIVGKLAPLVVGVAALPVAAAIVAQIALTFRRSAATMEAKRQKRVNSEADLRTKKEVERRMGTALSQSRETLHSAEASLAALGKGSARLSN